MIGTSRSATITLVFDGPSQHDFADALCWPSRRHTGGEDTQLVGRPDDGGDVCGGNAS